MIEDTIRAVKEAEAKADKIVADAKAKADGIVRDAESRSGQIIEEAKAEAGAASDSIMDQVKTVGEEKLRMADLEASKMTASLKSQVAGRQDAAVNAVIEALLG